VFLGFTFVQWVRLPALTKVTYDFLRSDQLVEIGSSLVRSQKVSLEFLIDIKSFHSHYGHGVDSASNRNEYQEHFLGPMRKAGNLTTILCRCHEIWEPQLPGTLWPTPVL